MKCCAYEECAIGDGSISGYCISSSKPFILRMIHLNVLELDVRIMKDSTNFRFLLWGSVDKIGPVRTKLHIYEIEKSWKALKRSSFKCIAELLVLFSLMQIESQLPSHNIVLLPWAWSCHKWGYQYNGSKNIFAGKCGNFSPCSFKAGLEISSFRRPLSVTPGRACLRFLIDSVTLRKH